MERKGVREQKEKFGIEDNGKKGRKRTEGEGKGTPIVSRGSFTLVKSRELAAESSSALCE
jgi:hypothetical protein